MQNTMQRGGFPARTVVLAIFIVGTVYLLYLYNTTLGRLRDAESSAERYRREEEIKVAQLQEAMRRKDEVQERCDNEKREFTNRLNSLNQQHKMLKSQCDEHQVEQVRLEQEVRRQREEFDQVNDQHNQEFQKVKQEKELEISSLKDQLADAMRQKEQLGAMVSSLQAQLQNGQKQLEYDQSLLQNKESEIASLKQQVDSGNRIIQQHQQQQQQQQQQVHHKQRQNLLQQPQQGLHFDPNAQQQPLQQLQGGFDQDAGVNAMNIGNNNNNIPLGDGNAAGGIGVLQGNLHLPNISNMTTPKHNDTQGGEESKGLFAGILGKLVPASADGQEGVKNLSHVDTHSRSGQNISHNFPQLGSDNEKKVLSNKFASFSSTPVVDVSTAGGVGDSGGANDSAINLKTPSSDLRNVTSKILEVVTSKSTPTGLWPVNHGLKDPQQLQQQQEQIQLNNEQHQMLPPNNDAEQPLPGVPDVRVNANVGGQSAEQQQGEVNKNEDHQMRPPELDVNAVPNDNIGAGEGGAGDDAGEQQHQEPNQLKQVEAPNLLGGADDGQGYEHKDVMGQQQPPVHRRPGGQNAEEEEEEDDKDQYHDDNYDDNNNINNNDVNNDNRNDINDNDINGNDNFNNIKKNNNVPHLEDRDYP